MIGRFRASVAAALLCISVSTAAANLELVTPPMIVISSDTPNATGVITIRNNGRNSVVPELTAGTFVTAPANEPLAIIAKFPPAQAVGAGKTAVIPVELSNVFEPGYALAELRDGATKLGNLRVLKKVFAFNVVPVGYDGKQPFPVHLVYGEPTPVTLMNSDPFTHSFIWSVRDDERELAAGRVPLLRPNETVDIRIPPELGGFLQKLEGTLQAPQSPARLLLRAVPRGPAGRGEYWVAKDVPLQLGRTAGDGAWRDLLQTLGILALLLAGGLTSLYLTYWVPNTLKKMAVMARVEDLTPKIHQLSRTPPTLRVLLSVHRNQLRERLKSRSVLNLDFLPLAAECEQRANALHRRVELAQKIEYLLVDVEREWENTTAIGPTVLMRVMRLLQKSIAQLEQGDLTEDDMRSVETQVAQAAQYLRSTTEDKNLTQEVVARAVVLQTRKAELQPWVDAASDLAPSLAVSEAAKPAWPTGFWRLDYAVTKMEIAANVQASPQERDQLLRFLRLHSLQGFEEAQCEARQIRQKVFPDDLKKALADKKARIVFHPEKPRVNALVYFELELTDPGLNATAAKGTFTCRWDFNDGLHEDGWRVSHYFAHPRTYQVKATVTDRDGSPIEIGPVSVIVEKVEGELVGARTRIEWIHLGVALFVVLLGLLAGAKEQLAKLEFVPALVALFLLGVTADQIKNLLAPKTP